PPTPWHTAMLKALEAAAPSLGTTTRTHGRAAARRVQRRVRDDEPGAHCRGVRGGQPVLPDAPNAAARSRDQEQLGDVRQQGLCTGRRPHVVRCRLPLTCFGRPPGTWTRVSKAPGPPIS